MASRLRQVTARQGDALLAVALSIVLVLELALGSNITGPPLANYGCGLVITLALARRRDWPVWVVVVQLVSVIVSNLANGDLTENPFAPFLALIVAMYSVGYYAPPPWSDVGVGVRVAGTVNTNLAAPTHPSAGPYTGPIRVPGTA